MPSPARLSRSLQDLIATVGDLCPRGVGFTALHEPAVSALGGGSGFISCTRRRCAVAPRRPTAPSLRPYIPGRGRRRCRTTARRRPLSTPWSCRLDAPRAAGDLAARLAQDPRQPHGPGKVVKYPVRFIYIYAFYAALCTDFRIMYLPSHRSPWHRHSLARPNPGHKRSLNTDTTMAKTDIAPLAGVLLQDTLPPPAAG